jgi:hypothetical protein
MHVFVSIADFFWWGWGECRMINLCGGVLGFINDIVAITSKLNARFSRPKRKITQG